MGTLAKRNSTSHINLSNAIGVVLLDPGGSAAFGNATPQTIRIMDGNSAALADVGVITTDAGVAANIQALFTNAAQHAMVSSGQLQRLRTPDTFKPFSATVASLGTQQIIWTQASVNKKFRVMGVAVTSDKATVVNFREASVATFFSTPQLVANTPFTFSDLGNGYVATVASNHVGIDVAGSVPVVLTGMIWGTEE